MEIKMLYVVELMNGERHYFGTETDRNYFLILVDLKSTYERLHVKTYEIPLAAR